MDLLLALTFSDWSYSMLIDDCGIIEHSLLSILDMYVCAFEMRN